jgi:hypothetical protein
MLLLCSKAMSQPKRRAALSPAELDILEKLHHLIRLFRICPTLISLLSSL